MNSNGAYRSVIMHVLKIIVVVASCLCMVLCSTACGPGGATSADGTASAPAGVSSSEPVQPDYLKTYADFTVPGLRSYAESKMMTEYRPHTELGSRKFRGNGSIRFSQDVADDEMYYAVFMCKQTMNKPVSIGAEGANGSSHTILQEDWCVEGVQATGLPASLFPDGTAMTVTAAGATEVVMIVYKFKAKLANHE